MSNNTEPLACLDPKFPSIKVRSDGLHEVPVRKLIAWAKRLGADVVGKEEAIYVILCHEYGEAAAKHFQDQFEKGNVKWLRSTKGEGGE